MSTWEVGPRPWIDVLDYRADPTGSTDSTAAFAAAEAAASAAGGFPIRLPPGTFMVNNWRPTLVNASWIGAGQNLTTLISSNGAPVIDVAISTTANNQYRFSGFKIDGRDISEAGFFLEDPTYYGRLSDITIANCGSGVTNAGHAFQMIFERMIIFGCFTGVVLVAEAEATVFRDSFIIANSTNQVEIGDGTTAVPGPITFDNCQITMTEGTITTQNVLLKSAALVNFLACYSEVTGTTTSCDIEIASSAQNICQVNSIGCNSNANTTGGSYVHIDSGVSSSRVLVQGGHHAGYAGSVINDLGTSSQVRVVSSLLNTTWTNDTFNGTALVYP